MKPLRPAGRPGTSRAVLLAQPCAADSIAAWIHRYLDALAARQITPLECRARKSQLAHFHSWAHERGIERPQDVTHAHVEAFQQHLFRYRKANGMPLAPSGQAGILGTLNGWYRWLVKHRHVPSNPAADVDLPRVPMGLR